MLFSAQSPPPPTLLEQDVASADDSGQPAGQQERDVRRRARVPRQLRQVGVQHSQPGKN